jgi:hypothetical protein
MRQARLGWVEGWEDSSELFLISFAKRAPAEIIDSDRSDETEFHLFGNRSHRAQRTTRVRPDQPRFKITVFQRYGPVCVLSGIHIVDMLEAAHLVPVPRGGSDDPRNGLPLNAALHRAFDADWFAIHPDTLQVCTVPGGPSLAELGIVHPSLAGLANPPHRDALQWRYENWCRRHTSAANNVRS